MKTETIDRLPSGTYRSYRRILIGLLVSLVTPLAIAGPVSVFQQVKYDWTYITESGADGSGSETETIVDNFAEVEVRPTIQGLELAEIDFLTDVDNGAVVRTKTDVALGGDNGLIDGDGNNLTHLELSTTQRVVFSDHVSTDDPDGEIFRFATQITGLLGHTIKHEGFTCDDHYSSSINVASGIGANYTLENDSINSDPGCGFDLDPISEATATNLQVLFIDLLYQGDPLEFEFEVSDNINLTLEGPDLSFWSALLQNDQTNTITTYASVFDINGNLLPDARVQSSFNFTYQPLPFNNSPVPVPSSLALMALGIVSLLGNKRSNSLNSVCLRPGVGTDIRCAA